jgi:hypothetical protein
VTDEIETVPVRVEDVRDSVVALTELRGWAVASPRKQRDFLLPRIDRVLRAFGADQIVARIHGDVLEGRPNQWGPDHPSYDEMGQ